MLINSAPKMHFMIHINFGELIREWAHAVWIHIWSGRFVLALNECCHELVDLFKLNFNDQCKPRGIFRIRPFLFAGQRRWMYLAGHVKCLCSQWRIIVDQLFMLFMVCGGENDKLIPRLRSYCLRAFKLLKRDDFTDFMDLLYIFYVSMHLTECCAVQTI